MLGGGGGGGGGGGDIRSPHDTHCARSSKTTGTAVEIDNRHLKQLYHTI